MASVIPSVTEFPLRDTIYRISLRNKMASAIPPATLFPLHGLLRLTGLSGVLFHVVLPVSGGKTRFRHSK
jgi:hypothetical protein